MFAHCSLDTLPSVVCFLPIALTALAIYNTSSAVNAHRRTSYAGVADSTGWTGYSIKQSQQSLMTVQAHAIELIHTFKTT